MNCFKLICRSLSETVLNRKSICSMAMADFTIRSVLVYPVSNGIKLFALQKFPVEPSSSYWVLEE